MSRRRGPWLVLAAMLAVIVVGCSSDHSPDPLVDAPDALPEEGSALPDGLTVPAGAFRIGPIEDLTDSGSVWTTTLALDIDPRESVDDLIGQLDDAGYEVAAACSPVLRSLQCDVRGRSADDPEDTVELTARRWRARMGGGTEIVDSRLELEAWTDGDEPWAERELDLPEPATSRTPRVGDPFDPQDWNGEDLVVVDGVEVVPPVFPEGCVTGGFDVDLLITGDVDHIVEDYREQFRPFDEVEEPSRSDQEVAEGMRTELGASGLGGTSLNLVIVDEPGEGPAWGHLSRCDD